MTWARASTTLLPDTRVPRMAPGDCTHFARVAGGRRFEVVGQQDRRQRRRVTQPLRLLVPHLRKLTQPGSALPVETTTVRRSAEPEHPPVEDPETPIERHHRPPQHCHFAERVVLGILLQRLEAPRDVHDLGLRLGECDVLWYAGRPARRAQ